MTELYSYKGAKPAVLPTRYRNTDGSTITDIHGKTEEELVVIGFTKAPPLPAQKRGFTYTWDGGVWKQIPLTVTTDEVNTERQERIETGVSVTVNGNNDSIHLTGADKDKTNLLGLAVAAQLRLSQGDYTHLTTFHDGGNVDHDLTPMQVIELWSKGAAWIEANYRASWNLKNLPEYGEEIPNDFFDDKYWPVAAI